MNLSAMNLREAARRNWRVAFVVWFVAITVATHWPQMAIDTGEHKAPDKLLHFACFGIMAFSLWSSGWFRHPVAVWAVVSLWALFDEVTQAFLPLGRPFSPADLLSGELGILAASAWMGALGSPAMSSTRDRVDRLLAKGTNWVPLVMLSVIMTLVVAAVVWSLVRAMSGASNTPLSLAAGLVSTSLALVAVAIAPPKWPGSLSWLAAVGACIAGLLLFPVIGLGSWVGGLFLMTLSARVSWSRVIRAVSPQPPMGV